MTAALIAVWVICAVGVLVWLADRYLHAPIERTGTDEQWAALMAAVRAEPSRADLADLADVESADDVRALWGERA